MSIEPLETNSIEILIKIKHFSFTKMHMKISFAKWRPFFSGGEMSQNYSLAQVWRCQCSMLTLWRNGKLASVSHSTFLALCEGNPPVTEGFPLKGQQCEALMFSLLLAWTNCWMCDQIDGDFRRYDAHVRSDIRVDVNNVWWQVNVQYQWWPLAQFDPAMCTGLTHFENIYWETYIVYVLIYPILSMCICLYTLPIQGWL